MKRKDFTSFTLIELLVVIAATGARSLITLSFGGSKNLLVGFML